MEYRFQLGRRMPTTSAVLEETDDALLGKGRELMAVEYDPTNDKNVLDRVWKAGLKMGW